MAFKEWTDDEKEEAYLYWYSEGEESFKKTHEHTGIPERTLYSWAKADMWKQRKADDLAAAAGPAVETFRLEVRLLLSAAARRLGKIIESGKNEDTVLKAIGMAYALSSDPIQTVEGADRKVMSLADARLVSMSEDKPDREKLLALASSSLESNMQGGSVVRKRRKHHDVK
jgi:hypothetical protein